MKYFAEEHNFKQSGCWTFFYFGGSLLYKCSKRFTLWPVFPASPLSYWIEGARLQIISEHQPSVERRDGQKDKTVKDNVLGFIQTFQWKSQRPHPWQITLLVFGSLTERGEERSWWLREKEDLFFSSEPVATERNCLSCLILMMGKKEIFFLKTFCKDFVNILFMVQLIFFSYPFHAQMHLCWCYPWKRHLTPSFALSPR